MQFGQGEPLEAHRSLARKNAMFFVRHPQPLLSTRAVAMQIVARKAQAERDLHVIVVEKREPLADTNAAVERYPADS